MSLPFGEYMETIKIVIDNEKLNKYREHYFEKYPKRKKFPIEKAIPPSLNEIIIMPRFKMNSLKQAWKEFGEWLVEEHGFTNKKIDKCIIVIEYFFNSMRRRDADNYTPKNIFDAFVSSGLLVDDSFFHVESLTIKSNYSKDDPRVEFNIIY